MRNLQFNTNILELTYTHIIGRLGMAVEEAKKTEDDNKIFRACCTLWYGVNALDKVIIACRGLSGVYNPEEHCIHLSYAMMNEVRKTANYIESVTGVNPIDKPEYFGKV